MLRALLGLHAANYIERDPKLVGPVKNIFKGTELRVTEGPHVYKRNGETAIQKAVWTDDGWLRLSNGTNTPDIETDAPDLPPHPWPAAPARTTFDTGRLPIEFQWLRYEWDETLFSLTERPGFLRLFGAESFGSWFRQALVARRQQAFRFTATTKVGFEPDTFQQAAGLVCYYNAQVVRYGRGRRRAGRGSRRQIAREADGKM